MLSGNGHARASIFGVVDAGLLRYKYGPPDHLPDHIIFGVVDAGLLRYKYGPPGHLPDHIGWPNIGL